MPKSPRIHLELLSTEHAPRKKGKRNRHEERKKKTRTEKKTQLPRKKKRNCCRKKNTRTEKKKQTARGKKTEKFASRKRPAICTEETAQIKTLLGREQRTRKERGMRQAAQRREPRGEGAKAEAREAVRGVRCAPRWRACCTCVADEKGGRNREVTGAIAPGLNFSVCSPPTPHRGVGTKQPATAGC
jgi:uncharacterized Rmd1/YagE family protein